MKRVNVAYGCIINDLNQVLMVYNADSNHWSMPGGKVEDAESLDQACVREVFEETGYTVEVNELMALNECKLKSTQEHAIFFTFHCVITKGEQTVLDTNEISQVKWLSFEEADKLMPYHKKPLSELIKNKVVYVNQGEQ
jgi:8-oxo-dGTP diphosphatase